MRFLVFLLLISSFANAQKSYQKNYFENGKLESAGWIIKGEKTEYWRFYHSNGKLKEEGHYKAGEKVNWWIFYDIHGKVNHKCQLKDGKKNGYCLMYKNQKLISAVKYSLGKKIKQWTDFRSFKKENRLRDLQ
ncbi:hypothetical protein DFQ05_1216 [Winogradskyella wandonensis]|uniref:MORN repeat protein n=1 Tax=Winogradskyella wandonensis TaxID=1442586 RepID=A0A4R1KS69_9FLAO|nr:hypothetical protein [Winogradskyella wandonensis]TCK67440.1 hypothetical protein DFQ05_1216 [Winogradskyella wandonensis]